MSRCERFPSLKHRASRPSKRAEAQIGAARVLELHVLEEGARYFYYEVRMLLQFDDFALEDRVVERGGEVELAEKP